MGSRGDGNLWAPWLAEFGSNKCPKLAQFGSNKCPNAQGRNGLGCSPSSAASRCPKAKGFCLSVCVKFLCALRHTKEEIDFQKGLNAQLYLRLEFLMDACRILISCYALHQSQRKTKVDQLKWQIGGKQVLELKLPWNCSGETPSTGLGCSELLQSHKQPAGHCTQQGNWSLGLFYWASHPWTEHQTAELRGSSGCKPLDHDSKLSRMCFEILNHLILIVKFSNPVYLLCCGNNQKLPDWDHPNSCWQVPSSPAKLIWARNNWVSYLLLHNCNKKKAQHPTLKGGGGQGKVHNWGDNPCLTHVVTSFM